MRERNMPSAVLRESVNARMYQSRLTGTVSYRQGLMGAR